VRLADVLRWVDLETEWCADLASVFKSFDITFDNSSKELDKLGGWKNFMFGRCPGAESLEQIWTHEALMVDHLLCDFYAVSDADAAAMGKLDAKGEHFAVTPARRGSYEKILEKAAKTAKPVFLAIPATKYEISAFNSSIWRYEDEKQVDNLIESLARYAAACRVPAVCSMMEVINVCQGAWGASDSATDRYHPQINDWAAKVKGTPDAAAVACHKFVYDFYTAGGKPHYKGMIWTLTDAFKAQALDCIRASQMIGCIYANAGYWGLRPVRIGRGNVQQKMIALSGHTFVDADLGAQDVCFDGLQKGAPLKPYEKMHAGDQQVLSCARGYRVLVGFVAGNIYFPQGPLGPVQLRMPHYNLVRKGFK
jgi:hypothetical protein